MGMANVYETDYYGEFVSLRDTSKGLSQFIPRCLDCQRTTRQYATQRYNRVINRAVDDKTSRLFSRER